MTTDQLPQIAAIVIAVGAVSYAIHLVWSHIIRPLYRAIIHISGFMEAYPTILTIAHEFEPDDGETLRDQVDFINGRLSNIEGQLESLLIHHR